MVLKLILLVDGLIFASLGRINPLKHCHLVIIVDSIAKASSYCLRLENFKFSTKSSVLRTVGPFVKMLTRLGYFS